MYIIQMGEEVSQILYQDMNLKKMDRNQTWCKNSLLTMEGSGNDHEETCDSISNESSSLGENSEYSISSISSSDLVDDASSSATTTTSSSSLSSSNGPLYELSQIMAQLPIKKGLSKHYQGKSQSFTSLASVNSIQDLPKKVNPFNYRVKMKSCKSYGWGLDGHNKSYSPKATISKKSSTGSRSCLMSSLGKRCNTSTTLVISEGL